MWLRVVERKQHRHRASGVLAVNENALDGTECSGWQGTWLRDYEPMSERKPVDGVLGAVPPSNAYRRRVAGSNWS